MSINNLPNASVRHASDQSVDRIVERLILFQHQPGDIDRGQRGVQMEVELVLAAGLALGHTGELLGVAEEKLDLKA